MLSQKRKFPSRRGDKRIKEKEDIKGDKQGDEVVIEMMMIISGGGV